MFGQDALIVFRNSQGIFFSSLTRHYQEDLLHLQLVEMRTK
ncbi:hypothetical protein BACDOR_00516 [Phocaeicola dorei DSM 17855]|uniref:Uncharacterized protein n=1 Tax=Phocaeicola dorei DSM 17855 TaxID=483217 RepID=B6VTS0_9BACT|nr:hypothetical protein BACDOR_00516 [Phocaeicola dorei DSM 17855]